VRLVPAQREASAHLQPYSHTLLYVGGWGRVGEL